MKSEDSNASGKPLEVSASRRDIVKATAWVVPAVVTLAVTPSFASLGSGQVDVRPQERP